MTEHEHEHDESPPPPPPPTPPPPSDVYANPQDTAFGHAAAEDQERVDRGEAPAHDADDTPRPSGKAEPT